MDNMKILIDGRLLSINPTGISRYTIELISSYEEKYGKENVSVICNSNIWSNQYNVVITSLKPFNIFHYFLFYFFLKKLKPEIYHSPYYSGSILKIKNIIQVLTVHDLMFYKVGSFFSSNSIINYLAKIYYTFIVSTSLRNAEIIISVSSTTHDDLKAIFGFSSIVISEGVTFTKNEVVNYDLEKEFLHSLSISKGEYLLYVGNNRNHKNISFLIDAFKKSKSRYKLVLAGFNDDSLKNNKCIINITSISDNELAVLYGNCKAFIFPSLYEGFGLPILEAIKFECLVLSSNAGSLSEFKFKSIKFFDPCNLNELVYLIENLDRFEFDLGDRETLKEYNWKVNFDGYQNYLQEYLVKNTLIIL